MVCFSLLLLGTTIKRITVIDPKTKTGCPLLGIKLIYYPEQKTYKRWFINDECFSTEKIVDLLGYSNKNQLARYMKIQGAEQVLTHGIKKV